MEKLIIPQTDETPSVNFNASTGLFEIAGKSLPEDVYEFYEPVLEWLETYKEDPAEETILHSKFDYFNTASSKIILDLFLILKEIEQTGKKVLVKWYFSEYDEDMENAGHEYENMVEIPFHHIEEPE